MFIEIMSYSSILVMSRMTQICQDFTQRLQEDSDVIYANALSTILAPFIRFYWPLNFKRSYQLQFTPKRFFDEITNGWGGKKFMREYERSIKKYGTEPAKWLDDNKHGISPNIDDFDLIFMFADTYCCDKNKFFNKKFFGCPIVSCPACLKNDPQRPKCEEGLWPETPLGNFMKANRNKEGCSGISIKYDDIPIDNVDILFNDTDFKLKQRAGDHTITFDCIQNCGFRGVFKFKLTTLCEDAGMHRSYDPNVPYVKNDVFNVSEKYNSSYYGSKAGMNIYQKCQYEDDEGDCTRVICQNCALIPAIYCGFCHIDLEVSNYCGDHRSVAEYECERCNYPVCDDCCLLCTTCPSLRYYGSGVPLCRNHGVIEISPTSSKCNVCRKTK